MKQAALMLAVFFASCVYAPKIVHLHPFTPNAIGQKIEGICVSVEPFSDGRERIREIGGNRNGMGMPAGEVRTFDDVASWVQVHVRDAIVQAGGNACSDASPKYTLRGKITKLYVDEYMYLDGRIEVQLELVRGDTLIFNENVVAKHRQLSHAASDGEFTDTIYNTLDVLADQVVLDVMNATAT